MRAHCQSIESLTSELFAEYIRGNIAAFAALQSISNFLNGLCIEIRKEQMNIIQNIVHHNVHLHRGSHHSSKKLGDIGCVIGVTERHHRFCAGAVPTGRKILFEENDLDASVVRYS